MQRGNDRAVRERERPFAKGLYRNIVAQLGAQLFQVASGQAGDGDQAPVTVSGRNCDAVDRGGMTLGPSLALLGALCRGFRDVQRANGESGANAESSKYRTPGPTCHDSPPLGRASAVIATPRSPASLRSDLRELDHLRPPLGLL